MFKDDVGDPDIRGGRNRRVVIAPEESRLPVEPESLDAAVDRQVGSVISLQQAVTELCPLDVRSHQLVREGVVAPERIAEEVEEIQAVPLGAGAGVLEVLPSV